ncbi:ABC transporter permease [Parapusillimonas granuli]|uniref:ABC transporter permease n=2 Tax=Parapusillimonas granuli TaxID=380911 RepID=A0A853FXZ5_9BURK|nr:ABC transporter permease [Parapusillimonas granuli]
MTPATPAGRKPASSAPPRRPRLSRLCRRGAGASIWAAVPATAFIAVLFLLPLAILFVQGFQDGTLDAYRKALTDGLYVGVLADTLLVAAYVSLICLLIGYPVAYFLATAGGYWPTIGLIFLLLPFWTSVLVRTYGWMVILGRNGIVNRLLLDTGVIASPIIMINNLMGVLIGMVHVLLPYMVFPLYAVMRRVDPNLLAAAEGLGASRWETFRRVYFPLTLPGVLAGATLVYVLSVGFYITPALLGGGKVPMTALLIEKQVSQFLDWGFASALSVVLLAATLVVYLILRIVLRGNMQWN